MNFPEWTGELWQWVLLIGACGGVVIIMAMFACALFARPGYQPIERKGSPGLPPKEE